MKKRQVEKFYYQLGTLLDTGFPLMQAFDLLEAPYGEDAQELKATLNQGLSLYEAIRAMAGIDETDAQVLRLAEETGRLAEAFLELFDMHRKNRELRQKLISFAIYPLVMLVLISAYLIFALFFMVPMMADLLGTLKVTEGFLFTLNDLRIHILSHWKIYLLITVFFIIAASFLFRRYHGALRLVLGKRYRLYLEVLAVDRMTKLLKGGKGIMDVLELTGSTVLIAPDKIKEQLMLGESLSKSLSLGGFSKELTTLTKIHEEGGNIVGGFELYLKNSRNTINATMENRIKLLEPLSMVAIGAVVGVTVVSIMGPLMDAFGKIQ
jgi:type II secretory pathway component PulF